ncbi:hypothetical protein Scep_003061 [Stephania cephalantha]|uniref:F-box domain-containing protein n=1 Tax=Stephania cephalantha TaxID=152367 RepID=A0AAP0PU32_9MAGN
MGEGLPDEIWRRIFEIGIEKSRLSYKDVCCVSITSRRLNRLSNEDTLWTHLLNLDFSIPIDDDDIVIPASKTLYKTMFDKDRERKVAAHRRAVLRAESDVGVCLRNLKQLQRQLADERDKARAAVQDLANLHRARSASVALNVWQPQIIRGHHQKQLVVEQCALPIHSRISALEMDLRLSKQQIDIFTKAYIDEKQRLDAAKKHLELITYHPLPTARGSSFGPNRRSIEATKLGRVRFGLVVEGDEGGEAAMAAPQCSGKWQRWDKRCRKGRRGAIGGGGGRDGRFYDLNKKGLIAAATCKISMCPVLTYVFEHAVDKDCREQEGSSVNQRQVCCWWNG